MAAELKILLVIIFVLAMLLCSWYALTHESGTGPGAEPVCVVLETGQPCQIR